MESGSRDERKSGGRKDAGEKEEEEQEGEDEAGRSWRMLGVIGSSYQWSSSALWLDRWPG